MSDWPTQQNDYQVLRANAGGSPYALSNGIDYLVVVDTSAGNVEIDLPPAIAKQQIEIKVIDALNVTAVKPNNADTIDGVNAIDNLRDQAQLYKFYAAGAWAKL